MRIAALILLLFVTQLSRAESYEEYWDKWHKDAEKVSKCDSIILVVDFLEKALNNLGNAERSEANSETIGNLIIGFPDCFCSAFIELSDESREKIKRFYLKAPLFHEKIRIDEALFSNKISKQCHAF